MPETDKESDLRRKAEAVGGKRFHPFSQGDPFHLQDVEVDKVGYLTSANYFLQKVENTDVEGGACTGISIAWLANLDYFWNFSDQETAAWAVGLQAQHANKTGDRPIRATALIASNGVSMAPMCFKLEKEGSCTETHAHRALSPKHTARIAVRSEGRDMNSDGEWTQFNYLKEIWERDLEFAELDLSVAITKQSIADDSVEEFNRATRSVAAYEAEVDRLNRCLSGHRAPAPRLPDRPVGKMMARLMTREERAIDACKILSLHGDSSDRVGHAVAAFVPAKPSNDYPIRFFDSNYGEFQFGDAPGFRTWFEFYWSIMSERYSSITLSNFRWLESPSSGRAGGATTNE